jgi:hypothetical protein
MSSSVKRILIELEQAAARHNGGQRQHNRAERTKDLHLWGWVDTKSITDSVFGSNAQCSIVSASCVHDVELPL